MDQKEQPSKPVEKYICVCGATISKKNRSQHENSRKHEDAIHMLSIVDRNVKQSLKVEEPLGAKLEDLSEKEILANFYAEFQEHRDFCEDVLELICKKMDINIDALEPIAEDDNEGPSDEDSEDDDSEDDCNSVSTASTLKCESKSPPHVKVNKKAAKKKVDKKKK